MEIYVILSSWNDVLYKLEAWSKSYYLSKVYYDQFNKKNADALFKRYYCNSITDLYIRLKADISVELQDIIDSNLHTKSSHDKKMYAIYKEKYSTSFNEDTLENNKKYILNMIGRLSLSTAPLSPYLLDSHSSILGLLFSIYSFSKTDSSIDIDAVYTWYFILNFINNSDYIIGINNIIPYETVFIQIAEY